MILKNIQITIQWDFYFLKYDLSQELFRKYRFDELSKAIEEGHILSWVMTGTNGCFFFPFFLQRKESKSRKHAKAEAAYAVVDKTFHE